MGHTYTRILAHCVFSTKGRIPSIRDSFRERLHQFIGGTIKQYNGIPIMINSVNNHIHRLLIMPANCSISDMLRFIKANSSRLINELPDTRHRFEWQTGYGAFTIGEADIDGVAHYIVEQEEHHRRVSFQEELLELLKRYNVQYEEKYLWD